MSALDKWDEALAKLKQQFGELPEEEKNWVKAELERFESYYDPEWLAEQRGTQPFTLKEALDEDE